MTLVMTGDDSAAPADAGGEATEGRHKEQSAGVFSDWSQNILNSK